MTRDLVVVTVREESNRIPSKIFTKITKNKTALDILLEHLRQFDVVVACSDNDPTIKAMAEKYGCAFEFGHPDSPLHRIAQVARTYDADNIIRITADDILIDQHLLKKQIEYHNKNRLDYTYMARCPFGVAGEVIKAEAIIKAGHENQDPTEFVSYCFKDKDKYRFKEYYPPVEYRQRIRVGLDYPEDVTLLRCLFSLLGDNFGTLDIINLHRKHPELWEINRQPVITFYTCNYNYGKYITECVDSVINQDCFELSEYIIYDDFSTDHSCDIILSHLEKYPQHIRDRIIVLRGAANLDLSEASNQCIDMARGNWVMRIDSDDILSQPDTASIMLQEANESRAHAVVSGYYELTPDRHRVMDGRCTVTEEHRHPACSLMEKWAVQSLRFKEKAGDGQEFLKRFEEMHKIKFIPRPLWYYRQHGESKTARIKAE